MPFKIHWRQAFLLGIIAGITFGPSGILYFFLSKGLQENSFVTQESASFFQEDKNVGLPMRLTIPKIGLNTRIEYVGLTPNGEMDTPSNIRNVGWFEPGVRPGEIGSAVIDGHSGWKDGKVSAFDNLHKLRVGDRLYIEDGAGVIVSFIVRGNKRYDPQNNTSEVFTSTDDRSHLNLITCEGVWDDVTQSYSKRLVVFTDKEY